MREALHKPGNFTRCYGCGQDNARGLGLRFYREDGTVVADFTPLPEHGGYGRIVHGGVTATAIDEALGWAVHGLLDKLGITTELTVRFLGPVFCGAQATVRGRIESHDERGAVVAVTITGADGKLVAEGRGSMRFVTARAVERLGAFKWE